MTYAQRLEQEVIHAAWREIRASFASLDPDRDLTFARIEEEDLENTGMLDFPCLIVGRPDLAEEE